MLSNDNNMDDPQMLEKLRQTFAEDPRIIPVTSVLTQGGGCIMVFQYTDKPEKSTGVPRPPVVSAEAFKSAGTPVKTDTPGFEVRHIYRNRQHIFFVRLTQTPDFDADILITLKGAWGLVETQLPFALGLFPAYTCQEGSVFTITLEAPPEAGASCKIEKRILVNKAKRTVQQQ